MRNVEHILKNWKHESKHKQIIQYKYDRAEKLLILYASRPGVLIGQYGRLVEKYTKLLNDLVYPDIRKVAFIEVEHRWI